MVRIIVLTGVMTMQINWFLLIIGIVPYNIKRQLKKDEQVLMMKALFWQLTIRWRQGYCSWVLSIPFIEHMQR